ncbi:MAG: DUF2520 domain-containing protein [Flavobacterium sp.]|nr:DUF2520 domain-containing protein [Flavobacterium sp.]
MIKISIIGSGNVAQHLIKIIATTQNLDLVQVVVRKPDAMSNLVEDHKICTDYAKITSADLYIIAVSDDAINSVSLNLPFKNKLVVHTSGSAAMNVLDVKNKRGVFYPLQTFSKNKNVNFKEIPICLEAENYADYVLLKNVADLISEKVYKIDSVQRKALHISAVFVCNFVNHMYKIANDICLENNIPFEILLPLISETADKTETLLPVDAQTGPAQRGDIETINAHLQFLSDENQKHIYKILTKSIIDNGRKL